MAQKEHDTKAEADLATHAGLTTTAHGGPNLRYGTLAARPSASAVNDGARYFATDDNGGADYQAQGGAWVMVGPKGVQLNKAQVTQNNGGLTGFTSETAIPGLDSFTVTFRDRPVELHVCLPLCTNNGAPKNVQAKLYDLTAGTLLVQLGNVWVSTANQGGPINVWGDVAAQTPGSQKTYKVTVQVPNGGTATVFADPTFPASIKATEV